MQVIDDEQAEKPKSNLLEYIVGGEGNTLILLSKSVKVENHYLLTPNKYVSCHQEDCMYCSANYEIVTEYNYWVALNGTRGYLNIKPGVFFEIQKIAKAMKKDARTMSWTVIKEGAGLQTKYTVSKNDNIPPDDYAHIEAELNDTTSKLMEVLEKHEERQEENYRTYLKDIKGQAAPRAVGAASPTRAAAKEEKPEPPVQEGEPDDPGDEEGEPEVKPDEIPF